MLIPFNLDFLFAYIMDDGVVRELEVVSGMFAILMSPVRDSVGHSGELGGLFCLVTTPTTLMTTCFTTVQCRGDSNVHVFHHSAVLK